MLRRRVVLMSLVGLAFVAGLAGTMVMIESPPWGAASARSATPRQPSQGPQLLGTPQTARSGGDREVSPPIGPQAPVRRLVVRVETRDGVAVPGASVHVFVESLWARATGVVRAESIVSTGSTDHAGAAHLDVPAPSRADYQPLVLAVSAAGFAAERVGVPATAQALEVLVRLGDGRSVGGTVVDPAGRPVAGASVVVFHGGLALEDVLRSACFCGEEDAARATTDHDGRFSVVVRGGATYGVYAAADGFATGGPETGDEPLLVAIPSAHDPVPFQVHVWPVRAFLVRLQEAPSAEVILAAPSMLEVRPDEVLGVLATPQATHPSFPLGDAWLHLSRGSGLGEISGAVFLRSAPSLEGMVTLRLDVPGYATALAAVPLRLPSQCAPGAAATPVWLHPQRGTLVGTVRLTVSRGYPSWVPGGLPVLYARRKPSGMAVACFGVRTAGVGESWIFERVPAGDHVELFAVDDVASSDVQTVDLPPGEAVDVVANMTRYSGCALRIWDLDAAAPRLLSAEVLARTLSPLKARIGADRDAGIDVVFRPSFMRPERLPREAAARNEVEQEFSWYYVLPPGDYELTIRRTGFEPSTLLAVVPPNGVVELEVVLKRSKHE